jgi:hypothetical protein
MFKVQIETVNDAFIEDVNGEIIRMLEDLIKRIDANDPGSWWEMNLHDSNGNFCGEARLFPGE